VGQEAQALEERLKAAEEELKALKDKYLRLLADFDNYRLTTTASAWRRSLRRGSGRACSRP